MEEGEIPKEEPTAKKPWILVIGAVISAVVLLVVLFAPLVAATETYTETETVTEDYERDTEYEVDRDEWVSGFSIFEGCYCDIYVKVRNVDDEGGTFEVTVYINDIGGRVYTDSDRQYIGPGDDHTFHTHYDSDCDTDYTWNRYIDPPVITDTRVVDKQIEKERTIYKSVFQVATGG